MKNKLNDCIGIVCLSVILVPLALSAETYYWTGGAHEPADSVARTPSMETPENWSLADGTVAKVAPTKDDDIVFTNVIAETIWSECTTIISTSVRAMSYNKIILTNEGSVAIDAYSGTVDKRSFRLNIPKNGIFNYTSRGALSYRRGVRTDKGPSGGLAEYRIHVENPDASFNVKTIYLPSQRSKIVKTGAGRYQMMGDTSNWYASNPEVYEICGGTMVIPSWLRSGYDTSGVSFVFKGDESKCLSLTKENGYYDICGLLDEENVATSAHLLTDEGSGATLVFSNIVSSSQNSLKNCRFSGILAGTLSILYDVQEWVGETARPELTLARGTSSSSGTLIVRNGNVNLTEHANYSSLSQVIVEANGKLAICDCAVLNPPRLTVAAGGELAIGEGIVVHANEFFYGGSQLSVGVYDKDSGVGVTGEGCVCVSPLSVSYDPDMKTAVPVDLRNSGITHERMSRQSLQMDVALSSSIALPDHTTNKILVARFAVDSGLTGEEFVDVTPKTYGLPHTWFETSVEEGETKLYLCSRPVVEGHVLERIGEGDSATHYFMKDAFKDMWSDGQVPHAGCDYLLRCESSKTPFNDEVEGEETAFPGESLTLARVRYEAANGTWAVPLRCYEMAEGSSGWYSINVNGKISVLGSIYLGVAGHDDGIVIKSTGGKTVPQIMSSMSGPADVTYMREYTSSKNISFGVLGDNSAHTGCVSVKGSYVVSKDVWNDISIVITNANALGGAMSSPTEKGFFTSGFSEIVVNDTTSFEALNREIFLENGLRISVADGKTFSIRNPIRCCILEGEDEDKYMPNRCLFYKTGKGTFALGAAVCPCAESDQGFVPTIANGKNNLVRVVEGGIEPLTESSFDNLQLELSDSVAIIADPSNEATQSYGLRLMSCVPHFDNDAIVILRVADGYEFSGDKFSVPFLTVPVATPDLSAHFAVPHFKSTTGKMRGVLVKENINVEGTPMTRYSVNYEKSGLVLIVR